MNQVLRSKRSIIPVLFAALVIVFLAPAIVIAQRSCDQTVVDEANVFSNRTGDVESAAKNLINSGADVRVRIIQNYGSAGNLDRYESSLEQQCPSWTDRPVTGRTIWWLFWWPYRKGKPGCIMEASGIMSWEAAGRKFRLIP